MRADEQSLSSFLFPVTQHLTKTSLLNLSRVPTAAFIGAITNKFQLKFGNEIVAVCFEMTKRFNSWQTFVQRWVVRTWFLRVMRGWSELTTWQQSAVIWLVRLGYSHVITTVDGPEHSATAPNVRCLHLLNSYVSIMLTKRCWQSLQSLILVYVYFATLISTPLLYFICHASVEHLVQMFTELLAIRSNDVVIEPALSQQQTKRFDGNKTKMSWFLMRVKYRHCHNIF